MPPGYTTCFGQRLYGDPDRQTPEQGQPGSHQAECDRAVYNMDIQFRLLGSDALKTAEEPLSLKISGAPDWGPRLGFQDLANSIGKNHVSQFEVIFRRSKMLHNKRFFFE